MTLQSLTGRLEKLEQRLSAKPNTALPSNAYRNFIVHSVRELAASMKVERIEEIYEACDKNALVFAKVVLSIYRRA